MKKTKVNWNLSDLYLSLNDPNINKDRKKIETLTKSFTRNYRNQINSPKLTANLLKKGIEDYQVIMNLLYKYLVYAHLLKDTHTASERYAQFEQKSREFANNISNQLLFFHLEWTKVSSINSVAMLKDPAIKEYQTHLKMERVFKPFLLAESEELILNKKSQTSSNALIRLYDELNSNLRFELKVGSKKLNLNYAQITYHLGNNPDRTVRKQAAESVHKVFQENTKIFGFILNHLLLDKKITDEIRNYEYPEQATLLSYGVTQQTVTDLTQAVKSFYPECARFYGYKKKLMQVDTLHEWDRYSSIYHASSPHYTWEEAKEIVLNTFANFSQEFAEIARMFFINKWIDAEPDNNKLGGAYCSYVTPSFHPYILMNFTGDLRSVTTLAHELGHGIHAYLSRKQQLVNYWPSTAIAEIASTFCEALVFEELYNRQNDRKVKLDLLAEKIQDIFATIFRQNAFYLFEKDIHKQRREQGELSIGQISSIFQKRLQETFGKSLELTEGHANWWLPIGHFYHYNFYVFTYAFGETLALNLLNEYKSNPKIFSKRYTEALALGSLYEPYKILKHVGLDVQSRGFWNSGLKIVSDYINKFQTLAKL